MNECRLEVALGAVMSSFVVAILIPSLLAICLCVVMLWRWRHDKHPVPPRVRNTFNRTFRRRQTAASVVFRSTTDGERVNNELNLAVQVRCIRII